MKRIASSRPKGDSGLATVALKNKRLVISFLDEDTGRTIGLRDLDPDQLPDDIQLTNAKYFVSLDATNTELRGIRPWSGAVNAKVTGFLHRDDQPPIPKQGQPFGKRRDGTTYPKNELTFGARAVITDGIFANMEIICHFVYASWYEDGNQKSGFSMDDEGNVGLVGTGGDTEKLAAFLEANGVAEKVIPFSENVLPSYERAILKEGRTMLVVMNDGWPQTYSALEPTRGRKAKPAKKTTKKTKK